MPFGFVFHGTAVSYHKDGSIKEVTPRVNGKVNGTQIGYREDGSTSAMETLYEKGKEISRKNSDSQSSQLKLFCKLCGPSL